MLEIKLNHGLLMLCDNEDYLRHYFNNNAAAFQVNNHGYVYYDVKVKSKWHRFYFHRFILDFPKESIDHINSNTLDNRKVNLRIVSHQQNHCNLNDQLQSNNISGVRGVYFDKLKDVWVAQIKVKGKLYNLGSSVNKQIAITLRKNAERRFGFLT